MQFDMIATLEWAVEQAKPAGVQLAYHPILSEQADGAMFTTVHVVTSEGRPVERSFDFALVAEALGKKAHPKIEDRKIYGQSDPVPYKVITGSQGGQAFEILFLLDAAV